MDFHLVSEDESGETYQAMQKLKTNEMKTEDGTILPAPIKYAPYLPKNPGDAGVLDDLFDDFEGHKIDSISISKTGGVVVKVQRKTPFEREEDGVKRLKPGGKT